MKFTAVIRQRGQLTIPDQIRSMSDWLAEGSVVGIDAQHDMVTIVPRAQKKQDVSWKDFLSKIALARSFKGKQGNVSSLIAQDRQSH